VHAEDNHSFDTHEPAFLLEFLFVCADKQNIFAVAVDGIGLEK
jgi:hypothetical protein